jgi:pimeloyl-ACP methyl ester carboxylesterase
LGEASDPKLALRAWSELYGLAAAHDRLCKPPVEADEKLRYWPQERLRLFNADLARRPYRSLVVVCPQTPRPSAFTSRAKLFDEYAAWLDEVLLPEVEARHPGCTAKVGLDGCSMGGYVAMEVFLRRPERFSSFGVVQSAIGRAQADDYAARFARLEAPRPRLRLLTSTRDPFRAAHERLARGLTKAGVAHQLDVLPGPHDQPWLREAGSLEMLRWHDLEL